jgi:hypothetical protein
MRKTILKSVLVACLSTTSFISCSSDAVVSNETTNTILSKPPPPGLTEFYYKEGGALGYTSLPTPFAVASTKTIVGKSSTGVYVIEMKLSSLAIGTYPINSINKFTYRKPGTTAIWQAITGTITISLNGSGMLSGSYNMTSGTGIPSVNSVSGYFELIPLNP